MCISPITLANGTQVRCQGCWLCRENRINDLVGRCCAEQATSDQAFSITLTYAGDTVNSAILCYRDIQLFLKRLRNEGFKPRYICAGEYGTEKGRAHWHLVLFLAGKTLEIVEAGRRTSDWQVVLPRFKDDPAARVQFAPWSNKEEGRGFAYFQYPDLGGFRYAMKYALSQKENSVKSLAMSKKPPLGYRFFMAMADDMVEARLPVQDPSYSFMHEVKEDGTHRRFWLQGRMRELFLDRVRSMWHLVHKEPMPLPEWAAEHYDAKIERRRVDLDPVAHATDMRMRAIDRSYRVDAYHAYHAAKAAEWLKIAPAWLPGSLGGVHTFVSRGRDCAIFVFEDHCVIKLGDELPWRLPKSDATLLRKRLLATGCKPVALSQLSDWILFRWSEDCLSFYGRHRSPSEWLKSRKG